MFIGLLYREAGYKPCLLRNVGADLGRSICLLSSLLASLIILFNCSINGTNFAPKALTMADWKA